MTSLVVWPVMLPLIGTLLALAGPRRADQVGVATSVAVAIAAGLVVYRVGRQGPLEHALGGWAPGLGIALRADALSAALMLMTALVALAGAVYATGYLRPAPVRAGFWPLWLLLVTALHALLLSGDLFNLYVTLELLGLAAVALAALDGSRPAVEAARRYLTVGLLGSMAFLLSVALLYAAYGTLDLPALAERVRPQPAAGVALVMMTGGLLIKAALFPLHFWLPATHANAPAPISAALSALVVKAAFYLVLRLWLDVFAAIVTPAAALVLGALGAIGVLWGAWQACRAARLKLLAAYSTVAQLGYLFLFLPLLLSVPEGEGRDVLYGALVLFALTHGFAKSALFLGAGVIQQQVGHDRIADLGGTARALPVTTFVLALAGVALIGLPPSGTFLAKWQLLSATIATGQWQWLPVVVIGSLLACAYVFRVLGYAFASGDRERERPILNRLELPALLLAIVATLVLGFGAALVWEFVAPGVVWGGAPQ